MARALLTLSLTLVLALSAAGCAVVDSRVRQDDGTYRTTRQLIAWSPSSLHSFTCDEDYMVASVVSDVTYGWPRGQGRWVNVETVTFKGEAVTCEAHKRTLTVNGRRYGEFQKGDRVRVTPDARVLVNEAEQPAAEGN